MDSTLIKQELGSLERQLKREKAFRNAVIIVLAVMTLYSFLNTSETNIEIRKFGADQNIEIKENSATIDYYKSAAKKLANLGFTYSPITASINYDGILLMVAPENYGVTQKFFQLQLEKIKKNNLSSVFYPREITVNRKTQAVIITGIHRIYSGEQLVEDSVKKYRFDFVIRNFKIFSFGFIDVTGKGDPFLIKVKP
jgi:type IV conjugative transfer system protein TraE